MRAKKNKKPQKPDPRPEEYHKYRNVLVGAEMGKVVTRFPPEPSGYLHIGHFKAVLLDYHYAKMWGGRMLLRFDDTNPSKEKPEFVQSIINDIATLGIEPSAISNTSDHFEHIESECTRLLTEGNGYCDNTPVEQMRKERMDGIDSEHRT